MQGTRFALEIMLISALTLAAPPQASPMLLRCAAAGWALWGFAFSFADPANAEDFLQNLPPGVYLQKRIDIPAAQRDAFAQKLGGKIQEMNNSFLQVQGRPVQMNVIVAETDADAKAIWESILKIRKVPSSCVLKGRVVVEYAGKDFDTALATKTSYELGLMPKPNHVRYRVVADLALVDQPDYLACNAVFEKFLALRAGENPQIIAEIGALAQRFKFGKSLVLRNPKLDEVAAAYSFDPWSNPAEELGCAVRYPFAEPPMRCGIPYVTATLEVSTNGTGFSASAASPEPRLLEATQRWPVADATIKALAAQITQGKTTNDDKVAAILAWLAPGKNLRYTGATGSRWGTLKVLEQKFGHCWDFSDCFVTLCRAAGVPSRQVAGWLYGTSGHVWAEFYREGKGWQQVDPTGGGKIGCGIYHIAYFTSEDGEMPIVYLSMPKITILQTDYSK
jgi:hypothetical protein